MKNRKALIGVIVLAVICIAAYVGVTNVEKKVESATREQLQALGASTQTVRYSLLSKELELGGIKFSFSFLGQKQDYSIRQVVVTSPDLKAFDPATPGRPLVAKSVVIKGLEEKLEGAILAGQPPSVSTGVFEEITLNNWRQNLGKVAEEHKKAPWSETFFAALLDYSVDSFTYKGGKGQLKQGIMTGEWAVERMNGKDAHDDVFSIHTENITFQYELSDPSNPSEQNDKKVKGSIARASVTDLRIPSAQFMATFMELAPAFSKVQENPYAPEAQAAAARLEPLLKVYFASTPYKNVTVENVVINQVVAGKEEKLCTLKSYSNSLHFSFPYNFELGVQDLFITDFFLLADTDMDMVSLSELGLTDLTLSADFKLRSPAEPELATLGMDVRIKDLGGLSSTMEARLPLGGDLAKLVVMNPDAWLPGVAVGKARIAYTDDGLMARRLALMSDETEVAPAELLPALNTEIQTQVAGLPIPGLSAAVAEMLNKPGMLTVSTSPAAPMAPQAMLAALMLSPAALNLEVKTTPGDKTILEQVAALQAAAEAAGNTGEEASAPTPAPAQGK